MPLRVLIIPLLGLVALVAVTGWAGGGDTPPATLFERVAAQPERYRDRDVRVTGHVDARSERLPDAFTLRGPNGRRLLVVPNADADFPAFMVGRRVAVRGALVPVDPDAEYRAHVVAVSDVAARLGAVAVVRAATVNARPES